MLFFYLITLLYGSSSLPLSFVEKKAHNNSSGEGLLQQVKDDPVKFISSIQNLDPAAIKTVISLLHGLKEESEGREAHLVNDLNNRQNALDQAASNVADAEQDLTVAKQAVAAAQEVVNEANGKLQIKKQEQDEAQGNLDHNIEIHATKSAEKDQSQAVHDDEIKGLNDEQKVLSDVINMLQGVHDEYSLVNVALGKSVTMSHMGWNGLGSKAVDGNDGGGDYDSGHCAHTLDKPGWIVLDLGRTYDIVKLEFTGRIDQCNCESQNSHWVVKIGDSPSGNPTCQGDLNFYGGADTISTSCDNGDKMSGRYVEMSSTRWMVLCELGVFAHVRS